MSDPIDFDGINQAALHVARSLLQSLLPGGKFNGSQYIVKNPNRDDRKAGSFTINYKTGVWKDFSSGEGGGDFVSLHAYRWHCGQSVAALRLADKLGVPATKSAGAKARKPITGRVSQFAPNIYPWGEEGPPIRDDEVRRHAYHDACNTVVKLKIKHNSGWLTWYRAFEGGKLVGWQAKKPDNFEPVPYVTEALNPFDPELQGDRILWAEGEKDVDSLGKLNLPAFTFGGVGDGLPADIEHYLTNRHLVILADNDDNGRKHAEEKAELANRVTAAPIRIVHFPGLPVKGDVSDFIANGGTVEQLNARIDDTPLWHPAEVDQIKSAAVPSSETAWENPSREILEDARGTLPEFPTEVFDDEWRDYVKDAARGAGVTDAHVAVPLIGVFSGVIGCCHRVKASRAWLESCALWFAVVGYSGTGKTPGIDVSKRALALVEKLRRGKVATLKREHETRAEAARAAKKKWEREVKEAIDGGKSPPPRPAAADDVGPFIPPRLYVSDVTVERVAILLKGRPSGLVLISDELSGLFLNMGRYKNGSDREFWLESWNGKHFVVERVGRDPVVLDHLLVAVVGGLQPDKLVRCFQGDNDGMYARICFTWPSEPAYRPLSDDCAENEPIVINALTRLVEELPIKSGDGQFVSGEIVLSESARALFEQFLQSLHAGKGGLYGRELEWWVKGPSHVLRLAGTLTFMSWAGSVGTPKPERIERKYLEAAIRIWRDYFWPHSRASLRQIGLTDDDALARRVLKWIRANKAAERIVSLMEIRREALGQSLNAKLTRALLERLEQAGWLRPETTPTGGRARVRWRVNDCLFDSQPSHAESAESAETVRS